MKYGNVSEQWGWNKGFLEDREVKAVRWTKVIFPSTYVGLHLFRRWKEEGGHTNKAHWLNSCECVRVMHKAGTRMAAEEKHEQRRNTSKIDCIPTLAWALKFTQGKQNQGRYRQTKARI